jgi:hypothetical protein
MNKFIFLICFVVISFGTSFSQSVSLTFRTVTDNGNYSPKHVLAVWIEDANGTFIKSCKVMAANRIQYLYTWQTKSGSVKTDAVTGATLTAHQTHTITWNCKNASNALVPNGTYKAWIEYTDNHAQGPITSVSFTVSGTSQNVTPVDQAYIKGIVLDFTPANSTGIKENEIFDQSLSVYPNPTSGEITLNHFSEKSGKVNLRISNVNGQMVVNKIVDSKELNNYPINLKVFEKGTYLVEIINNSSKINQKVIVY